MVWTGSGGSHTPSFPEDLMIPALNHVVPALAGGMLLVGFGLSSSSAVAHDPMPPLVELANDSSSIFIGTVQRVEPRRTDKAIRTAVTFTTDTLITGRGRRAGVIVLDQLGGDLGDEALSAPHAPRWEVGESYLVFTESPADETMFPTFGGESGYYRLVRDTVDPDRLYPVDVHDRPILGLRGGAFDLGRPAREITDGIATLSAAEPFFDAPVASDGGAIAVTATFDETAEVLDLSEVLALVAEARGDLGVPGYEPPRGGELGGAGQLDELSRGLGLCWCGWHRIFLTYEQVSSSWRSYDNNEWSMAQFNYYLDLHRYTGDDGTWGAPNDEDELCGFTSSSSLNNIYGSGSGWGSSTLAVNWTWTSGACSRVSEADIHVNPAFSWRYEFEDAFQGASNEFFYDPIMIHEMGHSLGLERDTCNEDYQFDRNTIMSAGSNTMVEFGKGLHRRDASVLRTVYDDNQDQAQTISRTDLGVESWYMDGSIRNGWVVENTVQPGDEFTTKHLVVENMSTWDVSNVRIRCFLSSNQTISESDHESPRYYYWNTFDFNADSRADYTWVVPDDTPPGDYWVGVMVTYGGSSHITDSVWGNNTTFFPDKITVEAADPPTTFVFFPFVLDWTLFAQFYFASPAGFDMPLPPILGDYKMGPSRIWTMPAPVNGKLQILPSFGGEGDNFTGIDGAMVAVYEMQDGEPGPMLGVGVNVSATEPLVVEVQAGRTYGIRIGGYEGGPEVEAWFAARMEPEFEIGSIPQLAIPYTAGQELMLPEAVGDPIQLPCASQSAHAAWFSYRAPVTGILDASTCGDSTDFPSVISIHADEPGTPLIACGSWEGQDCASTGGALAQAEVFAGQKLLIRVATVEQPGTFDLDLAVVRDPDTVVKCDTAPVVELGVYPFSTVGGAVENVPDCELGTVESRGTWFLIEAPDTGRLLATTCEDFGGRSSGRAEITIIEGGCDVVERIACNNFGCADGGATMDVVAGRPYLIHVSAESTSFGDASVSGLLAIDLSASPCPADLNGDGKVDAADLGMLLGAWGPCPGCAGDLDGSGSVDSADIGLLLAAFGDCL